MRELSINWHIAKRLLITGLVVLLTSINGPSYATGIPSNDDLKTINKATMKAAANIIKKLDKNGDGKLNAREIKRSRSLMRTFNLIDSNADGLLNKVELYTALNQRLI